MLKTIKRILIYSVFVLVPALSVCLNILFRMAQGERTEEILVGVLIGIFFDFLYSIALFIIYRRSKPDRIINIVIAALLAPVILFLIIGVLASVL